MPSASELTARALDLAEKCAGGLEATKTHLQAMQATLDSIDARTSSCGRAVERSESRERWERVGKVVDSIASSPGGKRVGTAICTLAVVAIMAVALQVASWAGLTPSYVLSRFAEPVPATVTAPAPEVSP